MMKGTYFRDFSNFTIILSVVDACQSTYALVEEKLADYGPLSSAAAPPVAC